MDKYYLVSDKEAGKRLDIWLSQNVKGCSRKRAKRLLDDGKILVNDKQVYIAGWKLAKGDKIKVLEEKAEKRQRRYISIIYEDRDIIVVDKPAGIISASDENGKRSMTHEIHDYLRRKYARGRGSYICPIHRLDSETSGVVVLAKSKIGQKLEDEFRRHRVERRYYAVVCGNVLKNKDVIDLPIEKGEFGFGRKARTATGKKGRRAITRFEVKERYKNATFVEIEVGTGRTHQIRVHFANLGHPLVGDKIYGTKIAFKRHALHAHVLGFFHPATGRWMRFISPMPQDIKMLIEKLRDET